MSDLNKTFARLKRNPSSVLYLINIKNIDEFELNDDKAFLAKYLTSKKEGKKKNNDEEKILKNLPTYLKRTKTNDLDNSKMLIDAVKPYYSFHADVADLTFTKQGIGPRYALVVVDLFSSFIWTYGMKKKSQLYDKLVVFYQRNNKHTNRQRV